MSLGLLLLQRIARRRAEDERPLTYGDLRAVLRESGLILPEVVCSRCHHARERTRNADG